MIAKRQPTTPAATPSPPKSPHHPGVADIRTPPRRPIQGSQSRGIRTDPSRNVPPARIVAVFGDPANPLRIITNAELEAINTAGSFVARQYGCIVTKGDNPPEFMGSGTLVRAGSQTVVATARHLFNGVEQNELICVWYGETSQRIWIRARSVVYGPPDLDIAILPLGEVDERGVSLQQVGADGPIDSTRLMLISGISAPFTNTDSSKKLLTAVWWTLGLCPLAESRWPKENLAREARTGIDIFAHYSNQNALDGNGTRMDAVSPIGLSGAGIWSVSCDADGHLSPSKRARLVGIQSSTEDESWNWLRATRIEAWVDLLVRSAQW